jgi:CHASE2 domain-containing sensor protein
VIIAANNAGTSDRHFTPYSRGVLNFQSDQMIGGEIHANIIETLLSGRFPRSLPALVSWLYVLVWLLAGTAMFLRVNAAKGLAAGVALGLLALLPAYLLFLQDWVIPVGAVHTGLGAAFLATIGWRLTGEEKERARLKQMFGRYVSDDVVDTLLAERDRPDLAGEERHVTVLFSDILNFTTISDKLDAR